MTVCSQRDLNASRSATSDRSASLLSRSTIEHQTPFTFPSSRPGISRGNPLGPFFVALLATAFAITGCVSKSTARLQAQAAYLAGQQQAMQRMQQAQVRGPIVTVLGQVRETIVPWTADLTLAKAIVVAGYYGAGDPAEIVITREGQQIPIDPKTLLSGQDVPLQPRDVIELKPAATQPMNLTPNVTVPVGKVPN